MTSSSSSSPHPLHGLAAGLLSHLPFLSSPSKPSSPLPASHFALPLRLPISSSSAAGDGRPPSRVRMAGAGASSAASAGKGVVGGGCGGKGGGGGGPAFVGQVFTMLDPSGNGLMAVTSRFEFPHFLSKRTPEWLKSMLSTFTKSENGPVFRFFMDLNDAVSYVKRLNVPTGMVGACRLDVAYEHFKEKPHMFQFVPNEKQVRAANKLLKSIPPNGRRRKLGGVPVFTAQNLNIAIATNDGIRWYTPYFFDKSLLDNILEASMDQHFHSMIQNRHTRRRRDVIDDSLTSEIIEESADNLFEPPEVREMMDEIGPAGIPLSVVTKAAEIQFLDVVDKVLLGNKLLRKATGIQPQFLYVVDSFEERSAASFSKAAALATSIAASGNSDCCQKGQRTGASELNFENDTDRDHDHSGKRTQFHFPFGNLLPNIWPRHNAKYEQERESESSRNNDTESNPLLPKITMVGISMGEGGQVSKANLKKTMEALTKELEQTSQKSNLNEEKDPLFVANVGDYSRLTKISST